MDFSPVPGHGKSKTSSAMGTERAVAKSFLDMRPAPLSAVLARASPLLSLLSGLETRGRIYVPVYSRFSLYFGPGNL